MSAFRILEETEEVIFDLKQIAILKHPKGNLSSNAFARYQKESSSYVIHDKQSYIRVKRDYFWEEHMIKNKKHPSRTLNEGELEHQISAEVGLGGSVEGEEADCGPSDECANERTIHKDVPSSSQRQDLLPGIPDVSVRLELGWGSEKDQNQIQLTYVLENETIDTSMIERTSEIPKKHVAEEKYIESPFFLTVSDFVQNDIVEDTIGGCAFEVIHTDHVAQLSFRHPLRDDEYFFRKIRLWFRANMELQDFLCWIDTLVRVRRCRESEPTLALSSENEKIHSYARSVAEGTRSAKRSRTRTIRGSN